MKRTTLLLGLLVGCQTPAATETTATAPAPAVEAMVAEAEPVPVPPQQTVDDGFSPWNDPDALPSGALLRIGSRKFGASTIGAISNDRRMLLGLHAEGFLRNVKLDGTRRVGREWFADTVHFTASGDALWRDGDKLWRLGSADDAQPTYVEVPGCSESSRTAFSPNDRWLACLQKPDDGTNYTVVDLATNETVRTWKSKDPVHHFAIGNDGTVASYLQGEFAQAWPTGGKHWKRDMRAQGVSFDDVGNLVIETNDIELVDPATGKQRKRIEFNEDNEIFDVVPGPNGTFFGSRAHENDRALVHMDADGKHLRKWPFEGYVSDLDVSSDQKTVLSVSLDGMTTVIDIESGEELARTPQPFDHADSWRFSPDERLVAVYRADGTVHLRDAATGEELANFFVPSTIKWAFLEFSPDGKTLAAANSYGKLILFDVASKKVHCERDDVPLTSLRWGAKNLLTRIAYDPTEFPDAADGTKEAQILNRDCETVGTIDMLGFGLVYHRSPAGEGLMFDIQYNEESGEQFVDIVRAQIDVPKFGYLRRNIPWEEFAESEYADRLDPHSASDSADGSIIASVDHSNDYKSATLRCRRGDEVLSEYPLSADIFRVELSPAGRLMAVADGRSIVVYPCAR